MKVEVKYGVGQEKRKMEGCKEFRLKLLNGIAIRYSSAENAARFTSRPAP
jgi:hypothetical protein